MLNKKDPLIDAIKQVMQSNQADRDAVKAVNEKFGIQDRRVLPHEHQGEWDAAYKTVLSEGVETLDEKVHPSKYSEKQRALAGTAGNKRVIDGPDLNHVRKHGGQHIGEEGDPSKAIPGDTVTGSGTVTTVPKPRPRPTEITPEQKNALTNKIKSIKEAKKASMCENNNKGFNNRHDSSVTASAGKQIVADQLNEASGVYNPNFLKKPIIGTKPKARIGDTGIRRTISGTNDVQTRLANLKRSAQSAQPLDKRDTALDNPNTESPMARAANPNIGGAGGVGSNFGKQSGSGTTVNRNLTRADATIASEVQSKTSTVPTSMSARDPKSSNALSARMRQTAGQRQGATAPPKTSTAADSPAVTQTKTNPVEPKNFAQAFSAARKAAAQKSSSSIGKFTYKGREYQTNIKGEKYVAASKQTDVTSKPTTTTSVTGGQGISGIASSSANKPVAKPSLQSGTTVGGGGRNDGLRTAIGGSGNSVPRSAVAPKPNREINQYVGSGNIIRGGHGITAFGNDSSSSKTTKTFSSGGLKQ